MLKKILQSPLRYPGGKSKLLKGIVPFFPKSFKEYREPFLGGASILLYVSQLYNLKKIIGNDLYYELFQFWFYAKNHSVQLCDNIERIKRSFQTGRELYTFASQTLPFSEDTLEIASLFFILNRITFSGISESGGYSQESYDKRFTPSSIQRVKNISSILSTIELCNEDYSLLLSKEGTDVFIYLDPPYYGVKGLYGRRGSHHNDFNHNLFFENITKCTHKWCITYDKSSYIMSLFSKYQIDEIPVTYGMRNTGKQSSQKSREIIIRNYNN